MKVGVIGAAGRMGQAVCNAVEGADDLELAVRVDPELGTGIEAMDGLCDVAVDFTRPDTVLQNALWCLSHGIHVVVGTTGLSEDNLAALSDASTKANIFVAPNFSIGAVLAMRFAAEAAKYFGGAEVIELHHNRKLDAPSGTALRAARGIAETWSTKGRPDGGQPHPDETELVPGARGAVVDGVHVHGVRLPGLVAHLDVLLGGEGETLQIRHDSIDRSSFMPGVLAAVRAVPSMPGLTVGLESILFRS